MIVRLKRTKPPQAAAVGPTANAAVSSDERKKHIGPVRAADVFQVRTGIDPRLDTIIMMAAGVSVSAMRTTPPGMDRPRGRLRCPFAGP